MLNNLIHQASLQLCTLMPLSVWHRFCAIDLVIPHWHVVSDQTLEHVSGIYKYRNIKQFKADIEFFLRHYKPINLQDIINHLDGFAQLPKRCFLATFDDGFREIDDIIAPILQVHGIPAVFFLITSVIDNKVLCYPQKKSLLIRSLASQHSSSTKLEVSRILNNAKIKGEDIILKIKNIYYRDRHVLDKLAFVLECDFTEYVAEVQPYLTSAQIKNLINQGFAVGAHSIDHPLYPELSIDEQLFQTKESMKLLSELYEYKCNAFAFPYSDTEISQDFFHQVFADGNLKVTFGIGGINHRHSSRNLPRFSMERTDMPARQILTRQCCKFLLNKT